MGFLALGQTCSAQVVSGVNPRGGGRNHLLLKDLTYLLSESTLLHSVKVWIQKLEVRLVMW